MDNEFTLKLFDESEDLEASPSTVNDISASRAKLERLSVAFQEAVDILDDRSDLDAYVESCFDNLYEQIFESGPIFESVDRDDKDTIKRIISKIRKPIMDILHKNDIQSIKPNMIARILFGGAGYADVKVTKSGQLESFADPTGWISMRLWQIVAVAYADAEVIGDAIDQLNEQLSDVLRGYKLNAMRCTPSLVDMFRLKFNWKNRQQAFWIVLDKKVSAADFKKMDQEIVNAMKKDD